MEIIFICYEGKHRPSSRVRGYGFAEDLAERGYSTSVISLADRFGLPGEAAYRLWDSQKLYYNAKILRELLAHPQAVLYVQKVGYHLVAPLLSQWINGNKLVIDYDDWDLQIQPFRSLRFLGFRDVARLTEWAFARADKVIVASHYLSTVAAGLGVPTRKLHYLPTAADTNQFSPSSEGYKSTDSVVFCWIGLIWNDELFESIRVLIAAFSAMATQQACSLIIAGNYYQYGSRLAAMKAAMPSQRTLQLPGWIEPESMPSFLAAIDIGLFLLTSDSEYNRSKSPTKLFEYLAMGKPTIVGFFGECMLVIDHGVTGFAVHNQQELEQAMGLLAENPELRSQFGANARQTAIACYSRAKVVAALEDVLHSLTPEEESDRA